VLLSLVIPVYNEEDVLPLLHQRLLACCNRWEMPWEAVFVNDGSTDGTLTLLKGLVAQQANYRVVNLSRNFGHQAALTAGLNQAKGEAIVVLDGDLQDPPELIPTLLQHWRDGYQVVYAIRKKRKEGLGKRLSYKLFYRLLARLSETKIPLDSGDFCLMDRRVVDVLKHDMPENTRFVRGLRAYAGFNQVGVEYDRDARQAGREKYTFRKLVSLALNGIFSFSTLPLRFITFLGLFASLGSFAIGLLIVVQRLADFKLFGYSPKEFPGLATLAVGLFFVGGVTLLAIGILGEYIGRIYLEVKRRPVYVIREVIESETAPPEIT